MPGCLGVPSDSSWNLLERLSVFTSVGGLPSTAHRGAASFLGLLHVPVKFAGHTIPEGAMYTDCDLNDNP